MPRDRDIPALMCKQEEKEGKQGGLFGVFFYVKVLKRHQNWEMRTVMFSHFSKISGFSLQNVCLEQGISFLVFSSKVKSRKRKMCLMHFEVCG